MTLDDAVLTRFKELADGLRTYLAPTVAGRGDAIEQLLIALLAGGHCVMEGPPGVARSLLAAGLARGLGLKFDRVRCTSELQPRELLGDPQLAKQPEVAGPLLANVVLLDDFPRLNERADAMIRQAIGEGQVDCDGRRHQMADPLLILGNRYTPPEEQDAVRETRDDRFMFKIAFGYPKYQDEYQMAAATRDPGESPPDIATPGQLLELRSLVEDAELPPRVIHYALRLARATRIHEGETPDFVYEWISVGAGPRAVHYLTLAAKIRAALCGRAAAKIADVKAVSQPALQHRIERNDNARSNGMTVENIISRLLYEIPEREEGDDRPPTEDDEIAW